MSESGRTVFFRFSGGIAATSAVLRENIGNIFFDPAFLVTVGVGNVEASPMPDDCERKRKYIVDECCDLRVRIRRLQ